MNRRPQGQRAPKEKLEQLYLQEQLSLQQLSDLLGVGKETLRGWLVFYGIPRRPRAEAQRAATVGISPAKRSRHNWLKPEPVLEYIARKEHRKREHNTLKIVSTRETEEGIWCLVR